MRVIGRDAKRLERFSLNGAEPVVADMTDALAVEKAFSGARAVHALIPPNIAATDVRAYQERVTDSLVAAIRNNGIGYTIVVSSTGADKPSGTGPVVGLHGLEKKLESIDGLNVLSLRCGYFMENLLPNRRHSIAWIHGGSCSRGCAIADDSDERYRRGGSRIAREVGFCWKANA